MKKIILIDTRKTGDWSLDLLFAGLVKNIGHENVIDWPPQEKHRMGIPVLVGEHEKDWGSERMSLSYVPEHEKIRRWSQIEVMEEIRQGNVEMIILDERQESFAAYLSLRANFMDVPVVLVSGHDRFWNSSPEWVKRNYYGKNLKSLFLDNWRDEYNLIPNCHLYSWSINFDHLWDRDRTHEKIYDISFLGYNSHPDRARFVDHIESRWKHLKLNIVLERRPDSFGLFVNKSEYFKTMVQSKICLNLKGAAENGKTLRFYEIPYAGSCMVTDRSSFLENQVEQFKEGDHYRSFGNEDELDAVIEQLLGDEPLRTQISENGHQWAMKHHTAEARVRQMLEKIRGQG